MPAPCPVHPGFHLANEGVDTESLARDYENHLGAVPLMPDGTFEGPNVSVTHPNRTVARIKGHWGGGVSNIQGRAGTPRLAAGFSTARFFEEDGSKGRLTGILVGLSEPYRSSAGRQASADGSTSASLRRLYSAHRAASSADCTES